MRNTDWKSMQRWKNIAKNIAGFFLVWNSVFLLQLAAVLHDDFLGRFAALTTVRF